MYSEGGSCSKKPKLTNVRKLILLCNVPQIKETYENCKLLFDLININRISFIFVSDIKLLLLLKGQKIAIATYPCPYGSTSFSELKNKIESSSDYKLKTYKDLRQD